MPLTTAVDRLRCVRFRAPRFRRPLAVSIRKLAQLAREDGSIRYTTYAWFHAGIVPVLTGAAADRGDLHPRLRSGGRHLAQQYCPLRTGVVGASEGGPRWPARCLRCRVQQGGVGNPRPAPGAVEGTELQDDLVRDVTEVLT